MYGTKKYFPAISIIGDCLPCEGMYAGQDLLERVKKIRRKFISSPRHRLRSNLYYRFKMWVTFW